MRTVLRSSMFAVGLTAAALAACGRNGSSSNRAMSDDLKRDLQAAASGDLDLASRQAASSYALTEINQSSAPSPSSTLKRGSGPKAVRSKHPTVKASPENSVVAQADEPQVEVMEKAPSPTTEPTPDVTAPAVPRPSPTPTDPNGGEGANGRNGGGPNTGNGGGGGSILGGIFGAILRGGVMDGDHCDPRTDGRRRPPVRTMPTYPGGWGGGRGPIYEQRPR